MLTISQALLEAVDKDDARAEQKLGVRKALVAVGAETLRSSVRFGLAYLSGGASEVTKGAIDIAARFGEKGLDAAKHHMELQLATAAERRKAVEGLREAVAAYQSAATGDQSIPLVVVVDELDRCRPDFALRLLDTLKHLFELRGVVFVLFGNREQLERAFEVRNGAERASGFLEKFVHLWITLLPCGGLSGGQAVEGQGALLARMTERLEPSVLANAQSLLSTMAEVAAGLQLPPRVLERCVTCLLCVNRQLWSQWMTAWLLGLMVHHRHVFDGVRLGRTAAHLEAHALAEAALIQLNNESTVLSKAALMHRDAGKHPDRLAMPGNAEAVLGLPVSDVLRVLAEVANALASLRL